MSDTLAEIVAATRVELEGENVDWRNLHRAARARSEKKGRHTFFRALRYAECGRPAIIAEIKSASPSAGVIVADPDVESIARDYRDGGAAALSVVTETRFFQGQRAWLHRASSAAGLPVIMKDFVIDPVQIYRGVAAGADAILLLASLLDAAKLREFLAVCDELGRDALVEVHDEGELDRAVEAGARIIGVNNRDLRDFSVHLETSERLGAKIPKDVVRVTESGIRTPADVARLQNAGFHAFLVGESLLRQPDRVAAVQALLGGAG